MMMRSAPRLVKTPPTEVASRQPLRGRVEFRHRRALWREARREDRPVPVAHHRQHRSPEHLGLAPIAAAPMSLRNHARRAIGPIRRQQPEHLPQLKPQQLWRRPSRQSLLIQDRAAL